MNYRAANGVSVIICCYNSAARLPETLRHIALQQVPPHIPWELIVVDNNSEDHTAETAQREWDQYHMPVPCKVVHQPVPGLIHARAKGVAHARYELLLFCDDDNWLAADYINYAYQVMEQHKNIAVLGGRSDAFFEGTAPGWFQQFEKAYAVGRPMQHSGIANERSYIAGAGMVMRKMFFNLFKEAGFKPLLTGRKGKALLAGEDSEICLMLLLLGYDLYYDERLYFTHYMPQNRIDWRYCVQMISKGHAMPQLYFAMYRYCHSKMEEGAATSFDDIYRRMLSKTARLFFGKMLSSKPFWFQFSLLLRSVPGSKEEIVVKSNRNKLLFLLKHKRHLRESFAVIQQNLLHLQRCHAQYVSIIA